MLFYDDGDVNNEDKATKGGEKDGKCEDAEDADDTVVCDGEWDEEVYDDNEDDHAMALTL